MKSTSVSHTLLLDQPVNRSQEPAAKAAEDFRSMLDPARFQTATGTASGTGGRQVFSSPQPSPALAQSSKLIQNAKGFNIYHNKKFYALQRGTASFHPLPLHRQQSFSPPPQQITDKQQAASRQTLPDWLTSAAHHSLSMLTKIKDWFGTLLFGHTPQPDANSSLLQTDSSPGIVSSILGLFRNFSRFFGNGQASSKTASAQRTRASTQDFAANSTNRSEIDNRAAQNGESFAGITRQDLPTAAAKTATSAHPLAAPKALRQQHVAERIHQVIKDSSAKYGLPAKLVAAVVKVESGFNPHAVSPAGAKGLMQLMPGTARDLRVKNCFDIEENVDAGCRYLKRLLDQFDGKVQLALAAYNAGSGAVKEYGGIPPYHETRRYVRKVLAYL